MILYYDANTGSHTKKESRNLNIKNTEKNYRYYPDIIGPIT